MTINICHLYTDVLNLYGDRGNVLCMKKRLEWRGFEVCVTEAPSGTAASLAEQDVIFIGGGQDFERDVLLEDIRRGRGAELRAAANDGKTILGVCGGYQLLGEFSKSINGELVDLIAAAPFHTEAGTKRLLGDFAFSCAEVAAPVIAFENHMEKYYLTGDAKPLGRVIKGFGNNGEDGGEGLRYKNIFCSNGHGPLLPKNPALCDLILLAALARRGVRELDPIDDNLENSSNKYMRERLGIK